MDKDPDDRMQHLGKRPGENVTDVEPKKSAVDLHDEAGAVSLVGSGPHSQEAKSNIVPGTQYQQIERDLIEYVLDNELSQADLKQRDEVCTALQSLLRTVIKDCTIIVFGSTINRLGVKNSDLDVYVDVSVDTLIKLARSSSEKSRRSKYPAMALQAFSVALQNSPSEFSITKTVLDAAVPILKLLHSKTSIDVDLSVNNESAWLNSDITQFLCDADVRIRRLLFLVKEWAKGHGLIVTGNGITSHALTLLVIFQMQQGDTPQLPPMLTLATSPTAKRRFINDWDCSFDKNKDLLKLTQEPSTTIQLFKSFVEFYNEWDFDGQVICPRLGRAVAVDNFEEQLEWRDTRQKVARFKMTAIKLQDIFMLDKNQMRGTNDATRASLIAAFRQTASHLASPSCALQLLLTGKHPEHSTRESEIRPEQVNAKDTPNLAVETVSLSPTKSSTNDASETSDSRPAVKATSTSSEDDNNKTTA